MEQEEFEQYEDQDLIDELGIDAWAAVMHDGALRTRAWERFDEATNELRRRYPTR